MKTANNWAGTKELIKEKRDKKSQDNIISCVNKQKGIKTGVFLGEPFAYEEENGELAILLNFFITDEDAIKVLKVDSKIFSEIAYIRDRFPTEKWIFDIKMSKNNFAILPRLEIKADMEAKIESKSQHDLYETYLVLVNGAENEKGTTK